LIVTGGNLLFEQEQVRQEGAAQAKAAADGVIQANAKMGITFAGVGVRDLAAGPAFLKGYHKPPAFAWLSLNLVDPATGTPLFTPYLLRQVGGVKIAILAVTDHTPFTTGARDFQVQDWRTSLPSNLTKVVKEVDFVLLLSNYSYTENQEIARKHGSIDLILQAGHAIGNMAPTPVSLALIAQTEIRGKYLGVLDIDWNGHGRWSEAASATKNMEGDRPVSAYTHRFIALKQSLPPDPETETLVKQIQQRIDKLQRGQTP
jgi:2',3'-cyclic-nucleotide 2'-phosphodiesterase (5'-nucleotidase family)